MEVKQIGAGTWEEIRDRLRVRLMDTGSCRETLRRCVSEPVGCGFALAAYVELPEEQFGKDRIANVPAALAEAPGFSERKILKEAVDRSAAAEGARLCSVRDFLFGGEPGNMLDRGGEVPEDVPLLVLTTRSGVLGAAALFYPEVQERIAEILGGDYFVLPSSVHEVLIHPVDGEHTAEDLAAIVREVNEQVSPAERLGNRVLRYRADLDLLLVAADLDRERDPERGR